MKFIDNKKLIKVSARHLAHKNLGKSEFVSFQGVPKIFHTHFCGCVRRKDFSFDKLKFLYFILLFFYPENKNYFIPPTERK